MIRSLSLGLVCALVLGPVPSAMGEIDVMTQNQYLGADLTPLVTAPDVPAFLAAVVAALQQIAANRPGERVRALAAEIAQRRPHLVGLQEVYRFTCTDLPATPAGQGCDHPSIAGAFGDHLQQTLDALGGAYEARAQVTNLDLPGIPLVIGGVPVATVGVVDRDVILARAEVEAESAGFDSLCGRPSDDGCNYQFVVEASTPLGPIALERGFVGVDAVVGGRTYRFVNTHLEQRELDPANPLLALFQAAQARELILFLAATTPAQRVLVVVGDLNSSPEHPTIPGPLPLPPPFDAGIVPPYRQLVEAGYADVWTFRPGNAAGLTCCQQADLSNRKSALYERIDMIFTGDSPAGVKKARVLGTSVSDKTRPPGRGLWPSDHGAVAAALSFE